MAKRKKGRLVSGWLAIDKPKGMGSTDVVNKIKWLFDAQKVGHGGTLDPMATGVLPIALGEATKTMAYALDANKSYEFTIHWGVETDSLDADGCIVKQDAIVPTCAEIQKILPEFMGEIRQVPPKVSAIKVGGKRAYDLARDGKDFQLESRQTTVLDLTLLRHDGQETTFSVQAVKGFYVRSLARDMAATLGTCGHLVALRRVRSGPFAVKDCIVLEKLEKLRHITDRDAFLMPLERALVDIPALDLGADANRQLRNGQAVSVLRKSLLDLVLKTTEPVADSPKSVLLLAGGQPVGIGQFHCGKVKPVRLFNL